jgi:hypothetical protein
MRPLSAGSRDARQTLCILNTYGYQAANFARIKPESTPYKFGKRIPLT